MTTLHFSRGSAYLPAPTIRLGVSVGAPEFEGEKLEEILSFIAANSGLKQLIVLVADTLQRHNGRLGVPNEQKRAEAKAAGDSWLERNIHIIRRLCPNVQVVRWDELLADSEYQKFRGIVDQEYSLSKRFQERIKKDVDSYLRRKSLSRNKEAYENASESSIEYFLEEIACVCVAETRFEAVEVYPGQKIAGLRYYNSGPLHPIPAIEKLKFVELSFHSRPVEASNSDVSCCEKHKS